MSWKEELKKFKGRFSPDEKDRALAVFSQLTDDAWDTNLTVNDIGILSRYLDDYAEKRLQEGDDDKLMEMMGFAQEIDVLEKKLEDVLLDTRELLLDLGM
jgi:hypothetical protein